MSKSTPRKNIEPHLEPDLEEEELKFSGEEGTTIDKIYIPPLTEISLASLRACAEYSISTEFPANLQYTKFMQYFQQLFKILVQKKPRAMTQESKDLVQSLIASEKIVIFSKTYCPYCKLAKEVFDKLKEKYKCVELDERDDGDIIQTILGELTGAKTVPRVFVNGKCLGGGSDVKALYEKGELQQLVA